MIVQRTFASYDEYVFKQGGKGTNEGRRQFLLAHLEKNTAHYAKVFRRAQPHLRPGSVLCLGARSGAESLGAEAAGFTGSVGIDLHPVGPTVLRDDWHALSFPPAMFANAYTNSLDHCLYLDRFATQVQRVLKADGRFYLMATNRHGTTPETWKGGRGKGNEALYWETSDELRDAVCAYGFEVTQQWRDGKWGHYVFRVTR